MAPDDKNENNLLIITVPSAVGAICALVAVVTCYISCFMILCKKKGRKSSSTRIWCIELENTIPVTDETDTEANIKKPADKKLIKNGICSNQDEGIVTSAKPRKDKDNTATFISKQRSFDKQGGGMVIGTKPREDKAAISNAKQQSSNKQGRGMVTGAKLRNDKDETATSNTKQESSNKQGGGIVTGAKSRNNKDQAPMSNSKQQSSNKQGGGIVTGAKSRNKDEGVMSNSEQQSSNKQGGGIVTEKKSRKDEAAMFNAKQQSSNKQGGRMVSETKSGTDEGAVAGCSTKQQSRGDSPKVIKVGTAPSSRVTTKDKESKPDSTTRVSRTIPEKGADGVSNKLKVNGNKTRICNGVADGGQIQVQNTSSGFSVAYISGLKPTRIAPPPPSATSSLTVLPTSIKQHRDPVSVSIPSRGYKDDKSNCTQHGQRM